MKPLSILWADVLNFAVTLDDLKTIPISCEFEEYVQHVLLQSGLLLDDTD